MYCRAYSAVRANVDQFISMARTEWNRIEAWIGPPPLCESISGQTWNALSYEIPKHVIASRYNPLKQSFSCFHSTSTSKHSIVHTQSCTQNAHMWCTSIGVSTVCYVWECPVWEVWLCRCLLHGWVCLFQKWSGGDGERMCAEMRMDANGCEWMRVNACGCDWMHTNAWMRLNASGCDWMRVDASECECGCDWMWVRMHGCDWMRVDAIGCEWCASRMRCGCDWMRVECWVGVDWMRLDVPKLKPESKPGCELGRHFNFFLSGQCAYILNATRILKNCI